MNTAVIGASDNPERYSYKALVLLREAGHAVFPVHPALETIEGVPVYRSLDKIQDKIDTITMYVSPAKQPAMEDAILAAGARRVIFNPGTENPGLAEKLRLAGVKVLEACTLVLLRTGRYGG
ncbi:MAG TPA: CoA-binding protein [Candidatus Ozemobacteraceae bacterium]|nr:CoA-binding protein [Candidatus Ozemobacteraceae bacterium]